MSKTTLTNEEYINVARERVFSIIRQYQSGIHSGQRVNLFSSLPHNVDYPSEQVCQMVIMEIDRWFRGAVFPPDLKVEYEATIEKRGGGRFSVVILYTYSYNPFRR